MRVSEILTELTKEISVYVDSTADLAKKSKREGDRHDEKRRQKGEGPLRRKSGLEALPHQGRLSTSVWSVLHGLGLSMATDRRGAARGLPEHWAILKYMQALRSQNVLFGAGLELSDEGSRTVEYYKAVQSRELGVGFGLALAEHVLRARHEDHLVSIVPADRALGSDRPGRGHRYRPQYLAEVWRPGGISRVFAISCKGNHGDAKTSQEQLASASAHVEGFHIGEGDRTPALLFSTEIPAGKRPTEKRPSENGIVLHALSADRDGGYLVSENTRATFGLEAPTKNLDPEPFIEPSGGGKGSGRAEREPGYRVNPEHHDWFQRTLVRNAAAGVTAFAGDDRSTSRYLPFEQETRFLMRFGRTHDARLERVDLFGIPFLGTDHVFRLNGALMVAFSGVALDLLEFLRSGDLERYRHEVHERRGMWPTCSAAPEWRGPVSVRDDGTVLAVKPFPEGFDPLR